MTLEELKNNYARERNWNNWDDFLRNCIQNSCFNVLDQSINEVCILAEKELLKKVAKVAKTKKEIVQSSEILTNEYATRNDISKVPMRVENKAEIKIVVDKASINNDDNLII